MIQIVKNELPMVHCDTLSIKIRVRAFSSPKTDLAGMGVHTIRSKVH
jgi:hypothetical protein